MLAIGAMKKKKKRARKKKKRATPARRRRVSIKPHKGPFQIELPLQMPLFPGEAGGPLGPVGVLPPAASTEKRAPSPHRQESLLGFSTPSAGVDAAEASTEKASS